MFLPTLKASYPKTMFYSKQNFSFDKGNFAKLCEEINKYLDVLKRNVSNLHSVLATLDPQLHALGVLAVL